MIEPKPETIDRLMAKFRKINYERGHLERSSYRLRRRQNPGRKQPNRGGRIGGGSKGDPGMLRFPPDVWARIQGRFYDYLSRARERGKDLSKHYNRQPYLMLAIRYELHDRERRLEAYRKAKHTTAQKYYCYRVLSRRAKMKMKGTENAEQRGHDRT